MPRVVVRVKKNERICYLFARRIWKSQKVVRALSRGQKTVQNEMEKKIVFYFRKTPDHSCFRLDKIYKKSADARFFGQFYNFFLFLKMSKIQKKTEKFPKNRVFPYALRRFWSQIRRMQNALYFSIHALK